MGASLNSPNVDVKSGPPAGDPASILAAALAQRKNKVSQSGDSPLCLGADLDDEDEGEDWD